MRSRARQSEVVRASIAKAWVDNYKMNQGCTKCGYSEHPVALHFNHLQPVQKHYTISVLVKKGSLDRIKEEISKCEILCANCHAIHSFANKHHDPRINNKGVSSVT